MQQENSSIVFSRENEQLVVDTCLQLVALIEQCDVPLHYVIPVKFHLYLSSKKVFYFCSKNSYVYKKIVIFIEKILFI